MEQYNFLCNTPDACHWHGTAIWYTSRNKKRTYMLNLRWVPGRAIIVSPRRLGRSRNRLFRQRTLGDWEEVFREMATKLRTLLP